VKNQDLKDRYEAMHAAGKEAWFDDGYRERQAIFEFGEPWDRKRVIEIGCGDGDLLNMLDQAGAIVTGLDFSEKAIATCKARYPHLSPVCTPYRQFLASCDVLVMQGVLEHLDEPLIELKWMINEYAPKTVITSSPCFVNPRGIVWMALNMLGAKMSLTDLHFINPWQIQAFCFGHGWRYDVRYVDADWGAGQRMIEDLRQRIPLALKDGKIPYRKRRLEKLLQWLERCVAEWHIDDHAGAVAIYKIQL